MEASLDAFRAMMAARVGHADIDDTRCYWPFAYAMRNGGVEPRYQIGGWYVTLDEVRQSHIELKWEPARRLDDAFDWAILDVTDVEAVKAFYAGWDDDEMESSLMGLARYWLQDTQEGAPLWRQLQCAMPDLKEKFDYQYTEQERGALFAIADHLCNRHTENDVDLDTLFATLSLSVHPMP